MANVRSIQGLPLRDKCFARFIFLWTLLVSLSIAQATELYQASYHYDIRGMVTNVVETYGGETEVDRSLEYDSLGRMIHEKVMNHEVVFQYDHLGNRIHQHHPGDGTEYYHTYNPRNELLQQQIAANTALLSYDLNGSLTQKVVGAVSTRYEWDSRGRLLQVFTNNVEVFSAKYAGGLKRLSKREGSKSKTYRHDGATAIQEVDEAGEVKELVRADRGASTVGGVLYSADSEGTNTYTYNGVGSTVVLSGENGEVKNVQYDAFGNILQKDEGVEKERLANTKELDESTGLYYHGARYYDATIGRYISMDPARDGANHYVYANNAPLSYVDPTGLAGRNGPGMPTPRMRVPEEYQEDVSRAIVDLIPGAGITMGWADVGYAVNGGDLGLASLMVIGMVIPGDKIAAFALKHTGADKFLTRAIADYVEKKKKFLDAMNANSLNEANRSARNRYLLSDEFIDDMLGHEGEAFDYLDDLTMREQDAYGGAAKKISDRIIYGGLVHKGVSRPGPRGTGISPFGIYARGGWDGHTIIDAHGVGSGRRHPNAAGRLVKSGFTGTSESTSVAAIFAWTHRHEKYPTIYAIDLGTPELGGGGFRINDLVDERKYTSDWEQEVLIPGRVAPWLVVGGNPIAPNGRIGKFRPNEWYLGDILPDGGADLRAEGYNYLKDIPGGPGSDF